MKKLIVFIITMIMLISVASTSAIATESASSDSTVVYVEEVSAYAGQTISVPVKLSNNKGLWGMIFNVCFDTSVFEVKEVRNNGEVFAAGDITIGPADFSVGYVRAVITPSNISKNNISNGTIFILKLKVAKDAEKKNYPFVIELEENGACDVAGNVVAISKIDGGVTVKEKSAVEPITTKKGEPEGELLAEAENNKYIDNETTVPIKTEIKTAYKTDKNGQNITNSKGEKETVTEIVEVTEMQTVEKDDGEVKPYNPSNNDVIFIILLAVLVIAVVVVIAMIIKKKK